MILVTHNPELAGRLPRRLEMVDGTIRDLTAGSAT